MAVFDSGKAPITSTVHSDTAKVPRSAFNMSRVVNTNGIIGALMPIDVLETIPNEDYTISYGVLATTRNPLVRKLNNGMKIYLHTYWCPKRELWKGWDTYLTKGRSGKITNTVPKLYPALKKNTAGGMDYASGDYTSFTPFAPSSYMGLPIAEFGSTTSAIEKYVISNGTTYINENRVQGSTKMKWEINALPFVMYNKIYRDYYMNQNLVQGNTNWFPLDDDDFILPYDNSASQGYVNSNMGMVVDTSTMDFTADGNVYVPTGHGTNPDQTPALLNCLHFRSFQGDYFTTANPFEDLLRGNKSDISKEISDGLHIDWSDVFDPNTPTTTGQWSIYAFDVNTTNGFRGSAYNPTAQQTTVDQSYTDLIKTAFEKAKLYGLNLNALRKAVILEKYMLRMATTNGTYREMVGEMFGYKPNVFDRKPRYVGGTVIPMTFSEIVQTSATQSTEYLGKTASRGSGAGQGYIGKYHSDDYGYLMTIMSIVPETYYAQQGIETMWNRTTQDKEYFPLSNNLQAQPILNKEIFLNESTKDGVFGWTERNADLKSRRNIITGLGACGNNAIYDSYNFMRREFTSTPSFNASFLALSPKNVDMKPFNATTEPPFDLMIGCNIDKVSPIPYTSTPADMGIKY